MIWRSELNLFNIFGIRNEMSMNKLIRRMISIWKISKMSHQLLQFFQIVILFLCLHVELVIWMCCCYWMLFDCDRVKRSCKPISIVAKHIPDNNRFVNEKKNVKLYKEMKTYSSAFFWHHLLQFLLKTFPLRLELYFEAVKKNPDRMIEHSFPLWKCYN